MLLKKVLSYIVCLLTPKSIVDAINEAASENELDSQVLIQAGISHADSDRV